MLADQKAQREVLAAKEAEQQALVDQTRGEEPLTKRYPHRRTVQLLLFVPSRQLKSVHVRLRVADTSPFRATLTEAGILPHG